MDYVNVFSLPRRGYQSLYNCPFVASENTKLDARGISASNGTIIRISSSAQFFLVPLVDAVGPSLSDFIAADHNGTRRCNLEAPGGPSSE